MQLQITIKDTGIGLNKNQISHLFSAFHQADASTPRKYGGTGFGLAISKHLIELMRGSLTVSNQARSTVLFVSVILLPLMPLIWVTEEIITITRPQHARDTLVPKMGVYRHYAFY